ncbi:uncharacterized protein LOC126888850 [Diabrotica virgifera virgifera]|uniref:Myb-like domain-containing protein n=1 Tax=Diabrotica virgifera virgifera TaxID=50390 RepID=A0ABM5KSR8_DIAVI|nr:uncharacterized protein LOC126888850 [Diabrotica virgifera virgifera]
MDLNNELQPYLMLPQTPSVTLDYKWSENASKLLIDLYKQYKNKVGTMEIRTIKMLWARIAQELKNHNIHVTANNCINRWRVLERNYKKFVDDQKQTGRKRKFFEYKEEMDEIFTDKVNIRPEIVINCDETDHDLGHGQEDVQQSTSFISDEPTTSDSPNAKTNPIKKKSPVGKGKRIALARRAREKFYQERLKMEREKITEMKRRTDLAHKVAVERNQIFRDLVEVFSAFVVNAFPGVSGE